MWVKLKERKYSLDEIQVLPISTDQSAFEKSAITFCQSWLNNQQEFNLFTSGSTGTPKEIILKRSSMEASAHQTIKALGLKPGDTSIVCLDANYVAGKMMLVRCLVLGMNIIVVEPTANPFQVVTEPCDFIAVVPYQLEQILLSTPYRLDQVRCAIIGGAAVSKTLRDKLMASKCEVYGTYGMTETISHIALKKLNGKDAQDYFEAFDGIQLRLDNRGCLCIKADYLSNEIITNDLVELLDKNRFNWLGRADNVINSGGIKVIPEKIEAALENIFFQLNINNRFFVAGIPDEKLGQRVIVFLEGELLNPSTLTKINNELALHLTKYELPKEFKYILRFTETVTGKINRVTTLSSLV